jgi:hypothetical protein
MPGPIGVSPFDQHRADEARVELDGEDARMVARHLRGGRFDCLAVERPAEESPHFLGAQQLDVARAVAALRSTQNQPFGLDGLGRPGDIGQDGHAVTLP